MPYGTSIAVGAVMGFIGMTTLAVSGERAADHAPPRRVPTELVGLPDAPRVASADRALPSVAVERPTVRATPRASTDQATLADPTVAASSARTDAFAIGPALPPEAFRQAPGARVRLPIGQLVTLRLIERGGQIQGTLVAADGDWVHLVVDGKDRLISRARVFTLDHDATETTEAVVAATTP